MLREFFTKTGIVRFLSRIRIGGFTVKSTLRENRANSKRALKQAFRSAVYGETDPAVFAQTLRKVVKTRKRQTLTTFKNIMVSVRGQARAVLATGKGKWYNRGILDGATTDICIAHMGKVWDIPYSQIPNRPPRTPPIHQCRSFLDWVPDGDPAPDERPFIEQFNASEELQRELLGKTRFEAFKAGDLPITTFPMYEAAVLLTLAELNLERDDDEDDD